MLLLSSMTTATIFCCGRSVAMLNAGCHNRNSNRQTSRLWRIQTTAVRGPRMVGAITRRRRQITQPRASADTASRPISNQRGHSPRSTKLPLAKTVGGYLKRNSNIGPGRYGFQPQHIMLLTLGVPAWKNGYEKEFRSQNSEVGIRAWAILNSEFSPSGLPPAPFDQKSMPFLHEYDSMELRPYMGNWGLS